MIGDHTNKKTEIYRLYVIYSISYIFHLPSPYFLLSSSYKKGVSSFLPFSPVKLLHLIRKEVLSCFPFSSFLAPISQISPTKEGSFILPPFFPPI